MVPVMDSLTWICRVVRTLNPILRLRLTTRELIPETCRLRLDAAGCWMLDAGDWVLLDARQITTQMHDLVPDLALRLCTIMLE